MKGRVTHRLKWRLVAFLAAAVVLAAALDMRLRPLFREYAVNCAQTLAGEVLATAVNAVLEGEGYSYDQLVSITRSESGAVLSAEANAAAINRLSAAVISSLNDTLKNDDHAAVKLPLLNATGSAFLIGRGPKITLRLQQNGAATTSLNSIFCDAGINQTQHRLELTVHFRAVVLAAGMSEPIETVGTFLVAETIIVGTVPDVVANITR